MSICSLRELWAGGTSVRSFLSLSRYVVRVGWAGMLMGMCGVSLVVYAVKGFRNTTMQALEAVSQGPTPKQDQLDPVTTFRPYGNVRDHFVVPFGIVALLTDSVPSSNSTCPGTPTVS